MYFHSTSSAAGFRLASFSAHVRYLYGSRAFLAEHEPEIVIHRAAKRAFDDLGIGKLSTMKSLQAGFAALLTEKQSSYAQLTVVRKELRELAFHKANYEELLSISQRNVEMSESLDCL